MNVAYPTSNTVSIWIGTFATESEFDSATETSVELQLQLPTDLSSVCEVFFEAEPVSIGSLLEGFSGWESFSTLAASAAKSRGIAIANSALVCYYVDCKDAPDMWGSFYFLGSFPGSDNN